MRFVRYSRDTPSPPTSARLRPVFKRDSRPDAGTAQPGERTQTPPVNQSPSTTPPHSSTSDVTKVENRGRIPSAHPLSSANKPDSPKVVRSTSIFSVNKPKSEDDSSESPLAPSTEISGTSSPTPTRSLDQNSLEVAWRKVGQELDTVDRAISMRMGSMRPQITDATTFELEVPSIHVENFFKENRSLILGRLQRELGGIKLTMTFKQIESASPNKILSDYEQLEKMSEMNPALSKLKEALNLGIG